jgi:futalosine hydrolase
MYILVAAATAPEIQPAIEAFRQGNRLNGEHDVGVLITGVGAMATTWSLSRQIDRRRPDLIIQAGIAGCLRDILPGEVLVVTEDEPADLGVWEDGEFKSIFDLRLADADSFPFSGGRLVNPYLPLLELTSLEPVRGITVNEITTAAERITWYQQNTDAVVESMEGAALHFVCLQSGVPFLQLRAISNAVGVRDKTKWEMGLALGRLNSVLMACLSKPALAEKVLLKS